MQVIACDDPNFVQSDEFYKIIRVPTPEAGTWALHVTGFQQPIQRSFIWAHSDNPGPDCWAGVAPGFLNGQPVAGTWIRAGAIDVAPLGRNVLYTAQVETPNGTVLPLIVMDINDRRNGAEHLFNNFQGRGRYDVLVTCLVTQASEFSPGERADLVDILEDGDPVTFLRQTRTSFFLDSPDFPPPNPDIDDCDGDGIPNTSDAGAFEDDDNDGIQNYCDTDDDGDGVPDTQDLCPDEAESFDFGSVIDGCPDPDLDLDGLIDSEERLRGTDIADPDSDDDGLLDGEEVITYQTDPLDSDSDDDGISDGTEILNGTDPNVANPAVPTLDSWGLRLLLVAMIAGVALVSSRRSRIA
jgi:hypothetical protein